MYRHIGRYVGRYIGGMSTECRSSIDRDSVDISTMYRPNIGRVSIDTSTDISVDVSTDVSVGAPYKIHDPFPVGVNQCLSLSRQSPDRSSLAFLLSHFCKASIKSPISQFSQSSSVRTWSGLTWGSLSKVAIRKPLSMFPSPSVNIAS